MEPLTIAIAAALYEGTRQVSKQLIEKGIVDPALKPAASRLEKWVQKWYGKKAKSKEKDDALQDAVKAALEKAGAPTENDDALERYAKNLGLNKLQLGKNNALRRQLAKAALAFHDPKAEPPEELVVALGWPRNQRKQLSELLAALHEQLYQLDDWKAPIEYLQEAEERQLLGKIAERLRILEQVFIADNQSLQVSVVQAGLSVGQAAQIEKQYKAELVKRLRLHDFRGIVQMKRAVRLPLADIYQELGFLQLQGEKEREAIQNKLLKMRESDRYEEDARQFERRVTDVLSTAQRLVILGEPGAGKTISLRFICLMLATGFGVPRLGLDKPFIPVMVRLADFARRLGEKPNLALANFLFETIGEAHSSSPHLGEYLRIALDSGSCMILLDGLDEVGSTPVEGLSVQLQVVEQVVQFADQYCAADGNRLVVSSRIEGYWDNPLAGFEHVQLSPLQPPDEVEAFLLRWFAAYEQAQDKNVDADLAEQKAQERVESLLPPILQAPSVRRLATNPLLLTILALIHESVGKLPNRRIELYEICANTLIESWRQAQTKIENELLADLGGKQIIRIMAPLAYWLHETHPGGTASFEEWQVKLRETLINSGFDEDADEVADRFLHHARYEAGLLAERGLGQFGFFHLTFEEYLAARQMARVSGDERRKMLKAHWEDARWHEIILLAAGQLGIVEAKDEEVGQFIRNLMAMEPETPENTGRQVVLAGRALADIGLRTMNKRSRNWVLDGLREVMQDLNLESKQPNEPGKIAVRIRYEAGEVLDELGQTVADVNTWVLCEGVVNNGEDLLVMKYPVTNGQYAQFVADGGYEEPDYWGGTESKAWQWRSQGKRPFYETIPNKPQFWQDARLGQERIGYPVVGVSWYEAQAFARWLLMQQEQESDVPLEMGLQGYNIATVRLPHEAEWERISGGVNPEKRYPWDVGSATEEKADVIWKANVFEANLDGTSPVGMYPLGVSVPYGVAELAGNVWEWMENWVDDKERSRALRGGSWGSNRNFARVSTRDFDDPYIAVDLIGFRLVAPISGS